MKLVGETIVCFANDWSASPTGKHHLMKQLSQDNRILWVESSGMRRPNLNSRDDLLRIGGKLRNLLTPFHQKLPGLVVTSPPSIPLPHSTLAQRINRYIYKQYVEAGLKNYGGSAPPILWAFAPHVAPYLARLPRKILVYYCVDRWSAFSEYNSALMNKWEQQLCRDADLVMASADHLAEHCRQYTRKVHYVPHGVDFEHFSQALIQGPIPSDLESIPEPRIGFFGLIHEWIDINLLVKLARQTQYSFVLIGDAKVNIDPLHSLDNVYLLGRKPYETLPDYCRGFHAAIIPFIKSELTRFVNPIKLREYAAAGLPVVSTDLPEVRAAGSIVTCVNGLEDWKGELDKAVRKGMETESRRRQSQRMSSSDWSALSSKIESLILAATS